jgi:hypothetical protein
MEFSQMNITIDLFFTLHNSAFATMNVPHAPKVVVEIFKNVFNSSECEKLTNVQFVVDGICRNENPHNNSSLPECCYELLKKINDNLIDFNTCIINSEKNSSLLYYCNTRYGMTRDEHEGFVILGMLFLILIGFFVIYVSWTTAARCMKQKYARF